MTDETSLVVTLYEVGVYFLVIYKDKVNFTGHFIALMKEKLSLKHPTHDTFVSYKNISLTVVSVYGGCILFAS